MESLACIATATGSWKQRLFMRGRAGRLCNTLIPRVKCTMSIYGPPPFPALPNLGPGVGCRTCRKGPKITRIVRTLPEFASLQHSTLSNLPGFPGQWYAYYSADIWKHHIEDYRHRFEGEPPSFCNHERLIARAGEIGAGPRPTAFITLCPSVWGDDRFRGDTIAAVIDTDDIRNLGRQLVDPIPRSLILLHEMFHTAGGDPKNTRDKACKSSPYSCLGRQSACSSGMCRWASRLPHACPPKQRRYAVQPGQHDVFRLVVLPLDPVASNSIRLEHRNQQRIQIAHYWIAFLDQDISRV